MDNEYILFLGQDGNFQTRSILIPARPFLLVRKDDYELLKRESIQYTFTLDNKEYLIDNLLIQNFNFEGNMGKAEIHPYTSACDNIMWYADCRDEDHYLDLADKVWFDNSIIDLCSGFNHIENYIQCKQLLENNIKILDSFLVLESNNDIIEISGIKTARQLLTKN